MSGRSSPILTSNSQAMLKSQEIRAKISVFKTILSDAGVSLSFTDEPHTLTQAQALVARDVEKSFDNSDKNVEEFIKSLQLLCKKEKYFRKCLLPCRFRRVVEGNETISTTIEIQQESLFRIFLNVNCLQKQVTDILLDEITTISSDNMQDTSWLRLLLNPLRYLSYISDPQSFSTKLLDILEVASLPAKLEILDSIPEIIPDSEYNETAKELCKVLDANNELSGAIIDCLNALDMDSDIRLQVRDRILAKILSGTNLKIFPVLLQFLLTDCKSQNMVDTLLKVRNALDTIMLTTEKNTEKESRKILIFNQMQAFAISPRSVTEAWLNMISSIKVHTDHKPIDYLILFMLHASAQLKRRIIEAIFKKRVHSGLFKITLLEKMFEKYIPQQLVKDYFNSIVEVGCSLLCSANERAIAEFATVLFTTLFNHEYTEVIYRREMLDSLMLLTGVGDQTTVSCVLKILLRLIDSDKLKQHTDLLMRLLEKLDTFELEDVKNVFEILCRLTCGEQADESLSGLKDEIHMVVRKQLSSSKKSTKYRGIISAVVFVKYTIRKDEEQRDVNLPYSKNSIITIAMLPKGPPQEAASLLEFTGTCCARCPELTGLYYDQLASILSSTIHLDKYFMAWLHDTLTTEFEGTYMTPTVPSGVNDLRFSMQYLLNTEEEIDAAVGVNIAGLTIECDNGKILLLAPHFRLLRLVHFRQQAGDLSSIDASLGAAVVMPEVEDVADLDTDQVRQVADCLFHCVNWFREVINGFVTQKDKIIRAKILQRLQHIIELEKKLLSCMERISDHKLPLSYFESISEVGTQETSPTKEEKPKNPKKKFKSAATVVEADETVASTSVATQPNKKKPSTNKLEVPEIHITFRQMDTDLALLFRYPLKFGTDDVDELATQSATLNIDQMKFILKDYVAKLATLIQEKNAGLSQLNTVSPATVMQDLSVVLPHVNSHFRVIVKKLTKLLETTDGRHDLPEMFTPEALDLKVCFGLLLEVFHLIFSWTGFQYSRNMDLLKDLLKSIRPAGQSQSPNSANKLVTEFAMRIASHQEQCVQLSHAVSLVKVMEALYSITIPGGELEKKILLVAEKLLSKRWYTSKGVLDTGKACNANIDALMTVYLKGASVETLNKLVGTLQEQASSLKDKNDCLHMLPSIDKQNFHILYMGLCNALFQKVKTQVQSSAYKPPLILWRTTALTMQGLMTIAKERESKINLIYFLRKSIRILNMFLSQGIPILETKLRSKPEEVVAILKTMQLNTRFLHQLCCYSKFTKDASLMAHVPSFKLTLETLVFKVKAMLAANNCSNAFWLGLLRNRDLQGDELLSQSSTTTDENINVAEGEGEEEELPDDDSDDDALVIDEDASGSGSQSESEVFD